MSVNIFIRDAVKKYGENTVIQDLTLDIHGGEFFTLLGPSGCGKTTLLRMIAGFNSIEGGDFYFNSTRINDLDPAKRNIGMVFQNYAIIPHMSVRKNVEFGLKNRAFDRSKLHAHADKFLKLMQIDQLADRMPDRLSGGQQQRVALARALCIEPDVLLMDEPLSNLDAKLRVEMRTVIKQIQNNVGITTVYVTHDQEEAMAVSDRIAVMSGGVIQHVGTPKNIYQRPANLFVATFIGRSNILDGRIVEAGEGKATVELPTGYRVTFENLSPAYCKPQQVKLCARLEELIVETEGTEGLRAVIDDCVFLGLNTHYFVHLTSGETAEIIQESTIDSVIAPGTATLQSIPLSTEEASISLGAGKIKTFLTVTTPMMANGIMSGAVLSWVAIVTELSSAIILYNNKTITLTMPTYAAISRGNDGLACAFAAILTVLTALSLILYLAVTKSEDIKL